ncbi:MAG: hypothetical protein IT423_10495 [Pirellulaceae bacterium]|nr:hypothetical protein [Pirellulaceae bacterium]
MNTRTFSARGGWLLLGGALRPAWGVAIGLMLLSPLGGMLEFSSLVISGAYAGSLEDGQAYLEQGQYELAIESFSEFVDQQPTSPEGYRGRIESWLMLRRYSDAMRDVTRFNALVVPADPSAIDWILSYYETRIAADSDDILALTGGSFAYWWNFDYATALLHLETLNAIAVDDAYGILFRGSSRLLSGENQPGGVVDFEYALFLDPFNPHARFIVADGYTYGLPDPDRAFVEAWLARLGGLDTPRINAIVAACFEAWGSMKASAFFLQRHIQQVTTNLVMLSSLSNNQSVDVFFEPGKTIEIPVTVQAGKKLRIETSSPSEEVYDTVAVLLAPNGTPLTGSDDTNDFFAAFQWTAPVTTTYRLRITTFEAVSTGLVKISRK